MQPYVPFTVAPEYVPHFYGVVFTLISVIYAILGGMSSIVWADVVQYLIMRWHFIDKDYSGVYWRVDYTGQPLDMKNKSMLWPLQCMA